MKSFKNKLVYVEGEGVIRTNLSFDNIIKSTKEVMGEEIEINDDDIIVPGFIDEHIHGAGNSDAMDASFDALKTISNTLVKEGTTTFLATTMTQSYENIMASMRAIKEYKENESLTGARLEGIHLEGPFISLNHVGAQPKEYVVKPSIEIFKEYNQASGNNIKIVSYAVEEDKDYSFTKYLKDNNIVASIGHSDATYNVIEEGIKYGLSNVTHTYNAQSKLHHREIGTVGSALLFDELNTELICDTIHVSVPAIKLLFKNKKPGKFTLITDAMRAKGIGDCLSELGGQEVFVKNGEARLKDGTLAGSVLLMNNAVKNLNEKVGVEFTKAIDAATINPAMNLKIDDTRGSIKTGKYADFTVLDKDFNVKMTIVNGEIVYKA